jgi:hypothetical protein
MCVRAGRRLLAAVAALAMLRPINALAGPPFVTDDPVPVENQGWEINTSLVGTLVRDGGASAAPSVDINYGAQPWLQLHLQPQVTAVWAAAGTEAGIGDTQVGAKIRLLDEDKQGWAPMVSVYPIFTAPTGNAARGLGAGLGNIFLPVWVDKTFGKWIVDGGAGYSINPGTQRRNSWFAGALLLYQLTDVLQLGGEVYQQTAAVRGTPNAPGFNLGGSYDFSQTCHILFSAGRGFSHASGVNIFSYYLGLQLTF